MKRQFDRAEMLQDRAKKMQDTQTRIMGTARRLLAIVIPIVIALLIYLGWIILR